MGVCPWEAFKRKCSEQCATNTQTSIATVCAVGATYCFRGAAYHIVGH